ncbi:LamG-like jellyroll fold domain-containing protein [Gracilibacillus massiliensis]|uniref:LamG-like jellyroll fold domain-containing protein n=1 Tax=Gracilibacillus massiliensis TaxID=1564956 RepID=UPI00097BE7C2|nr:LamG-like jellyroll fold domain-containing protein [Gracilibacillus massiliensis]
MKYLIQLGLIAFLVLLLFIPSTVLGEEQTDSEPIDFERVSVHDPSIIKAKDGTYYVHGSHIAAAKSTDLSNWTSLVESEYQTPENNPIYGNLSENLAESFEWAGEDDADSSGGFAVWAPDIFWNKDFVWDDGSTGAYMMYYSVSSTYNRSAIGIAVSKDVEGPFEYTDTIMYSGFTDHEAYDNNSDVNKHWENTNISDLIDEGVFDEPNPDWFTDRGTFNNAYYTNAIDANILYDKNGALYMTYGSWSGGTFILELDKETGTPIYPGEDGETSDGRMIDRYFGTKIAGGYGRSGEGTYAVYDEETGYYYLYITYGGLASDGGYQMRQFRSENIDGPYVDAAGREAVFPESFYIEGEYPANFPGNDDHKEIGNKMMGNFLFKRDAGEEGTGNGTGYMSPGHNSYLIDDDGKEFIVTHVRFPEGGIHEVRVHQTFKNSDKWPVPTPYHYAGETIEAVSEEDVAGNYKYINHGKEITAELTESTWVALNEDHTVSGAVSGTWELYDDYRVELTVDEETYDGVFIRQYDPTSQKWVMTFSAMSNDGVVIWGSAGDTKDNQEVVDAVKNDLKSSIPSSVITDINLPTTAAQGTEIKWESSATDIISNEGVVVRPSFGSYDATVELTATITLGDITETETITVTVPAQSEGGLSAFYDFSDGFKDRSGNRAEATVTGNRIDNTGGEITLTDGVVGQAAKFDGNSGLLLDEGLIASNTYTVSLWLKPEELTNHTTSFFGGKSSSSWISILPYSAWANTMVWSDNGGTYTDLGTDTTIPLDEWSHVALTVEEGEAVFYINGEAKATSEDYPEIFTTLDGTFALGVNYWDTPYKGLMDEVRVYDGVALPEENVQSLYNNPEEITAHYSFEENLEDESGNSEPGTTTGNLIDNTDGSITYSEGIDGQAAEFDGESGIRLPDGLISSNKYSVSLWLNPSEINEFTTSFFGAESEGSWSSLVPNGHGVTKIWSGEDWYDASIGEIIPTNEWTHLAYTVNEGEITVYVNGEAAFTGEGFPNIFTTTDAKFALGVNYWDAPYKGLMDDLRIYGNKVLSSTEVSDYFTSITSPETDPGDGDGSGDEGDPGDGDGSGDEGEPGDGDGSGDEGDPGDGDGSGDEGDPGNEDDSGDKDKDKDKNNKDKNKTKKKLKINNLNKLQLEDNIYKIKDTAKKVTLTKKVIDQLDENASIELDGENVTVNIPVSILKDKEDIEFEFDDVSEDVASKNTDALSSLYDFKLLSEGKEISFDSPITVTFTIDPDKVENWDNINVVYIDDNGDKKEVIVPNSIVKTTGEVVAELSHFSIYGVFELADEEIAQIEDAENTLPDTATNQYNWLILGLVLMAVGGSIFLIVRNRKNTVR